MPQPHADNPAGSGATADDSAAADLLAAPTDDRANCGVGDDVRTDLPAPAGDGAEGGRERGAASSDD